MCYRELQIDGTLSERTLELAGGLLARSPLLALCNDRVSLHGARWLTAIPLAPLYPESGLLLESTCADFDGAGSTASVTCSSAAAEQVTSSVGTGSDDGGAASGTDVGTNSSLVVAGSPRFRLRSAIRRRPDLSVPMQCFPRCR